MGRFVCVLHSFATAFMPCVRQQRVFVPVCLWRYHDCARVVTLPKSSFRVWCGSNP